WGVFLNHHTRTSAIFRQIYSNSFSLHTYPPNLSKLKRPPLIHLSNPSWSSHPSPFSSYHLTPLSFVLYPTTTRIPLPLSKHLPAYCSKQLCYLRKTPFHLIRSE